MEMKELAKRRSVWLGAAMIWIIWFHSGLTLNWRIWGTNVPVMLKASGYGGVDICLFASGLGCYSSLHKNPDALAFLGRRIRRLAPTYLCFIALWLIGMACADRVSLPMAVGNVLGIRVFSGRGDEFNWYIGALLMLYLFTPYFKLMLDRSGSRGALITIGALILCSFAFWEAQAYIVIMTRIPIYFMGMAAGKMCLEGRRIAPAAAAAAIAASALGMWVLWFCMDACYEYLWPYGLHWYPFILITPGLCLGISWAACAMEKTRWLSWIVRMLETIGRNSFELYLLHIPLAGLLGAGIERWGLEPYVSGVWLVFFALLPVVCVCFKVYVRLLCGFLRRIAVRTARFFA